MNEENNNEIRRAIEILSQANPSKLDAETKKSIEALAAKTTSQ
jgi:hypothetical protein